MPNNNRKLYQHLSSTHCENYPRYDWVLESESLASVACIRGFRGRCRPARVASVPFVKIFLPHSVSPSWHFPTSSFMSHAGLMLYFLLKTLKLRSKRNKCNTQSSQHGAQSREKNMEKKKSSLQCGTHLYDHCPRLHQEILDSCCI